MKKRLPDFDHYPALGLRAFDAKDYDPPQLDPRYIRPLKREDHDQKTTGRKGESKYSSNGGGDTSQAAKVKRLREAEEERAYAQMRRQLLATSDFVEAQDERLGKKDRPKRKIQSRGFQKGRKFQRRNEG